MGMDRIEGKVKRKGGKEKEGGERTKKKKWGRNLKEGVGERNWIDVFPRK